MGEKGVRGPSRRAARKNAPEPRGLTVLPGTYKVVMHYAGQKDSTMVKVAYDPRMNMSNQVLQAKYDLLKDLEKKTAVAGKAVEQLKASKKIVSTYKKQLKEHDGEAHKDLIKLSDSISKSIGKLIDGVIGKEDKRQGITRNPDPTPMSFVFTARRYVGALQQMPGKTETDAVKNAHDKIKSAIDPIKEFYAKQWPEYRKKIEALNLSLFKDYEELKE